jgi:hypothetical protein
MGSDRNAPAGADDLMANLCRGKPFAKGIAWIRFYRSAVAGLGSRKL